MIKKKQIKIESLLNVLKETSEITYANLLNILKIVWWKTLHQFPYYYDGVLLEKW